MRQSSIRQRIVGYFLLLIVGTILVLNIALSLYVKSYYYNNTEQSLKNQINLSIVYYKQYFASSSLKENIYNNIDSIWDQTNVQVQILDQKGNLLMDSIGVYDRNTSIQEDVKSAIKGNTGRFIGKVDFYEYKVMAVSAPIIIDDNIVGIVRYITSLELVDYGIQMMVGSLIIISLIVLVFGVILCLYLGRTITNPIKEVTNVAQIMASGDMTVRSNCILNDEVGQLSSTLNYMAAEILKKDKLKNEFISSVSHELRTPLTSIKGWAITINQDISDKNTIDLGISIIEKEADRLTVMVEELLDFSRFVNGRVTLRKSKVSIADIISYTEYSFAPRAEMEGKKIIVIDNTIDKEIYVDNDRLKQVILNIIDNSFKFTDIGGEIKVKFLSDNRTFKVEIVDNGCGIDKSDLARVKEKFYKGKNSKSKNGIGLSICDEIITMHNGEFNIESVLGEGTKVTVILPLEGGI